MPYPSQTSAAPAAPQLYGSAPRAAYGEATLLLPRSRDGWTYMVSPSALECAFGHVVPILARAYMTPGRNGNAKLFDQGEGARMRMQREGYREVPHDVRVHVFGQIFDRANRSHPSNYLSMHTGEAAGGGGAVVFHEHKWRRPQMVGRTLTWEQDWSGWLQFRVDVLQIAAPTGLQRSQVQQAMRRQVELADDLLERVKGEDRRAMGRAHQVLQHLPPEHAPERLRTLIQEARAMARQRGEWFVPVSQQTAAGGDSDD